MLGCLIHGAVFTCIDSEARKSALVCFIPSVFASSIWVCLLLKTLTSNRNWEIPFLSVKLVLFIFKYLFEFIFLYFLCLCLCFGFSFVLNYLIFPVGTTPHVQQEVISNSQLQACGEAFTGDFPLWTPSRPVLVFSP